VGMLVRGASLGASMSRYLIEQIDATPNIEVSLSTEVVGGTGSERLEGLELRDGTTGTVTRVPADALFVMIGASPHTNWLPGEIEKDANGFVITGADLEVAGAAWPLERPPSSFETSVPGIYAVGDMRSGSVKRVAAAVGEGSVVIQQVHAHLSAAEGARPAVS